MTKVYLVTSHFEPVEHVKVNNVWFVYTNKKKAEKKAEYLNKEFPDLAGIPRHFTVEEEQISY